MATLVEVDSKRSHSVVGRATIGRADSCEIRVDDPMVSASHAEIVEVDGQYQIRDLDSRRGTYVGSKKVKQAQLRDGDELMIGPMRMRFKSDSIAPVSGASDSEELTRLRAIVELGRAIGVEHDLPQLLARVLETCFQLLRADRGAIVLYEPHSKSPYLTVTRTRSGSDADFTVSTSVLTQIMASHEPYLRTEVDADVALQRSESLHAHGVRSVMAVPLRYEANETEWLGLIQLDSRATTRIFGPRELDLLGAIAGPAALAIKNAMLVRRVQSVISDETARIERVVRDLPLGIVVLDNQRTCTMVNQWVTRRADLAIRPGEVVDTIAGVPCEQLIGADLRTQITAPGGAIFSISANTSSDNRETVIVINDITSERERQNQAAHKDRVALIGQLAGGVAHDFNNLLHVILTCAGMLEENLQDSPENLEDARQVLHAATSAAELTRQLLTFSRRELVKPGIVDVPTVVTGMEKMLVRTLGTQIELVTKVESRVPRILIDRAQLEQILMNLVVNARDAMLGRGRVELAVNMIDIDPDRASQRAISPGSYVCIEVVDTGSGMAPEVAARVFEPYFTTKSRGKGTGLGLATVHGIVQQARGDITVESTLGKGTTFRIYLPATEKTTTEERVQTGDHTGGGTVLIVDDDDNVRRVTERILRNANYQVLSAASGQAALALAKEHGGQIDLLLTDIVMPGISGRDLARELGYQRPITRVVFMSGYHQHTPITGSQFIAKPFTRASLLEKMRDAFAPEVAAGV